MNFRLVSTSCCYLFPFPVEDDKVFCSCLWKVDCTLMLLIIVWVVGWCQLPVYFYFLFLWKTTRYFVRVFEKLTVLYCYCLLFELWADVNFLFFSISFSCGRPLGILFNFVKRWLYSIVIDYFFRVVGWCQLPVYFISFSCGRWLGILF